ncbi:MAG: hypothetical protein K2Q10_01760, partial [Rhodospirillales bacterium]|nr:hypothetical protein [Rhodospirillales bacterium]
VLSRSGEPRLRLEDAAGWPLTTPAQGGTLEQVLEPGDYRLVVVPPPVEARLVTLLEPLPEPPRRDGHGPHALPLEETLSHQWIEPQAGGGRVPDLWTFTLSAPAELSVTLGDQMVADLLRDGQDQPVAALTYRKPWQGRLDAGAYRLAVRSERPNNRLDYTLATAIRQLIPGRARDIEAPGEIPLSVAESRPVEIDSFGGDDVRAVLLDADGREIARADDRPDDWNFTIARTLPPGAYRLKVEPVGGDKASTRISLRQPAEIIEPALAPGAVAIKDDAVHVFPLDLPAQQGTLLLATARSAEAAGLAIERRRADGAWERVGQASGRTPWLAVPRDPAAGAAYRLRLWSQERGRTAVEASVALAAPPPAAEAQLAQGVAMVPVPGLPVTIAAITLPQPGLLRLHDGPPGLRWASSADRDALTRTGALLPVSAGTLWLAA